MQRDGESSPQRPGAPVADSVRESALLTALSLMSPDESGRPDVLTSYSTLPSAFGASVGGSGCPSSGVLLVSAKEASALADAQRAALSSLAALRGARDRSRITQCGIICCLNVGTDPPEKAERAAPLSIVEAWIDPSVHVGDGGVWGESNKTACNKAIGHALSAQYKKLMLQGGGGDSSAAAQAPRPKITMDPFPQEVEKMCAKLRKLAPSDQLDRILIHINGHGVPPPTPTGDLWVFNPTYTQYVPLPARDLVAWTGRPAFFVLDCDSAATLIPFLTTPEPVGARPPGGAAGSASAPLPPPAAAANAAPFPVMVLAACGVGEFLPTSSAALPADFFTACLTTPIRAALGWALHSGAAGAVLPRAFLHCIDALPGRFRDKRSPLGELESLLVAVTDAIAWATLPRPLFTRLFRADPLAATIWRHFLLADHMLRRLGCTPASHPPIPRESSEHPLWSSWDDSVAHVLTQLPACLGYSLYDMQRIDAFRGKIDAAGARASVGGEWGSDVPVPAAAVPPAPVEAHAPPPAATASTVSAPAHGDPPSTGGPPLRSTDSAPIRLRPSGEMRGTPTAQRNPSGLKFSTPLVQRKATAAVPLVDTFIPASVAGFGACGEMSVTTDKLDPLSLPVSAAASATASQRVALIRHRLRRFLPTVVSGPAIGHATLGPTIFTPSTLFDDTLTAFEVWLRAAGWIARTSHAPLALTTLESLSVAGGARSDLAVASHAFLRARATRRGAGVDDAPGHEGRGELRGERAAAAERAASERMTQNGTLHFLAGALVAARRLLRGAPPLLLPTIRGGFYSDERSGAPPPALPAALPAIVLPRLASFGALPIVLQALLYGQRARAMHLIARFMDLGTEACTVSLLLGLHQYILKLSLSPDKVAALPGCDAPLVLIWTRIIALEAGKALSPGADITVKYGALSFLASYVEARVCERRESRSSAIAPASVPLTSPLSTSSPHTLRESVSPRANSASAASSTPTTAPGSDALKDIADPTLLITGDFSAAALFSIWRLITSTPSTVDDPAVRLRLIKLSRDVLLRAPQAPRASKQWALLVLSAIASASRVTALGVLRCESQFRPHAGDLLHCARDDAEPAVRIAALVALGAAFSNADAAGNAEPSSDARSEVAASSASAAASHAAEYYAAVLAAEGKSQTASHGRPSSSTITAGDIAAVAIEDLHSGARGGARAKNRAARAAWAIAASIFATDGHVIPPVSTACKRGGAANAAAAGLSVRGGRRNFVLGTLADLMQKEIVSEAVFRDAVRESDTAQLPAHVASRFSVLAAADTCSGDALTGPKIPVGSVEAGGDEETGPPSADVLSAALQKGVFVFSSAPIASDAATKEASLNVDAEPAPFTRPPSLVRSQLPSSTNLGGFTISPPPGSSPSSPLSSAIGSSPAFTIGDSGNIPVDISLPAPAGGMPSPGRSFATIMSMKSSGAVGARVSGSSSGGLHARPSVQSLNSSSPRLNSASSPHMGALQRAQQSGGTSSQSRMSSGAPLGMRSSSGLLHSSSNPNLSSTIAASAAAKSAIDMARSRARALEDSFPEVSNLPFSVTIACLGVCSLTALVDASPIVRLEAISVIASWVSERSGSAEAAMVAAAGVCALDAAADGAALANALKIRLRPREGAGGAGDDTDTDSASVSAAVSATEGGDTFMTADAASGAAGAGAATGNVPEKRGAFTGLRRWGSRLFGSAGGLPSSPQQTAQPHATAADSPHLSRRVRLDSDVAGAARRRTGSSASFTGDGEDAIGSSAARALAAIGLPSELMPLPALAAAVRYAAGVAASLAETTDKKSPPAVDGAGASGGTSATPPPPTWLLNDSHGAPSPLLHSAVRTLGTIGPLYVSGWLALCAATTDADPSVAAAALSVVRRVSLRLVHATVLETLGCLSIEADAAAVLWRSFEGPSISALGFAHSGSVDAAAARFMRPLLAPATTSGEGAAASADSLSPPALARSARERLLVRAVAGGVTLAATAWSDDMAIAVAEAASELEAKRTDFSAALAAARSAGGLHVVRVGGAGERTRARRPRRARAIVGHGLSDSSFVDGVCSEEVALGRHLELRAREDPAERVRARLNAFEPDAAGQATENEESLSTSSSHPSKSTILSSLGNRNGSAGLIRANSTTRPPHRNTGSVDTLESIFVDSQQSPVFVALPTPLLGPEGSLSLSGSYGFGGSLPTEAYRPVTRGTPKFVPVSGGGAGPPSSPTGDAVDGAIPELALGESHFSSDASTAGAQVADAPRPQRKALNEKDVKGDSGGGSTRALQRKGSARATVTNSRSVPSSPALGGAKEASHASLMRSPLLSDNQDPAVKGILSGRAGARSEGVRILSSEFGGGGTKEEALTSVFLRADRLLKTAAPIDAAPRGGGRAFGALSDTNQHLPLVPEDERVGVVRTALFSRLDSSAGDLSDIDGGMTPSASVTKLTASAPIPLPLPPPLPPSAPAVPLLSPRAFLVTAAQLSATLRELASQTPRLPPALVSRMPIAAVRSARAAARKLSQKCLLDLGPNNVAAGLLFHPMLGALVVADSSGGLSSWDADRGACVARWHSGTATTWPSGSRYGVAVDSALWPAQWTRSILRAADGGLGNDRAVDADPSDGVSSTGSIGASTSTRLRAPFGLGLTGLLGSTPTSGSSSRVVGTRNAPSSSLGHGTYKSSATVGAPSTARARLPESFVAAASRSAPLNCDAQQRARRAAFSRFASVAAPVAAASLAASGTAAGGHASATPLAAVAPARTAAPTTLGWVDEHDGCHLLTASADGIVRIWHGSDIAASLIHANEPGVDDAATSVASEAYGPGSWPMHSESTAEWRPRVVTSFLAMPELARGGAGGSTGAAGSSSSAATQGGVATPSQGLVTHYLPGSCTLAAAGAGSPFVRLWDLKTQRCAGLLRVPDRGGVPAVVTAFTSAWPSDSLVVAGTASGLIHVLDTRLAGHAKSSAVMTLAEHSRYIVGVSHARAQSPFALVSGSVGSDVRSWDLRISRCVHAFNAFTRGYMTALAHHDYAPLLATGSARQQAKVFSNSGDLLADVRFHESFSGQRIGQVSALAWHPHRLMLAIGATDSMIDIYG